jgi:pyruvate dehydrogenase E2 component (dihydrolipoamide acetyltransferase)
MRTSTDHILTSHAGSLPRPDALIEAKRAREAGEVPDERGYDDVLRQSVDGFVRASRRRDATEVLGLLVDDPALVSRAMVEDVLRYKRLDGVSAALAKIAAAWFAGGRQSLDLTSRIAALTMPVQLVWGRNDRIIPVAHAEALAARLPVHIIDAAGHLPHMEKAAEVNRMIGEFVRG